MVLEITSIYKIYAVENSIYSTYSSLYIKYIYAVESENSITDLCSSSHFIYEVCSNSHFIYEVCSRSHYYTTDILSRYHFKLYSVIFKIVPVKFKTCKDLKMEVFWAFVELFWVKIFWVIHLPYNEIKSFLKHGHLEYVLSIKFSHWIDILLSNSILRKMDGFEE